MNNNYKQFEIMQKLYYRFIGNLDISIFDDLKITRSLVLLFFIFFLWSCKTNTNSSTVDFPFKQTKEMINGFYVRSSGIVTSDKEPYKIAYIYKANIINNTNYHFNKVISKFAISLLLENGNTLTKEQFGSGYFGEDIMEFTINYDWKPNTVQKIERLISSSIPVKYIDYPIKKAFVQFTIECDDQINNTKPEYTEIRDITQSWIEVVDKVKNKKIDCSNFANFVEQK